MPYNANQFCSSSQEFSGDSILNNNVDHENVDYKFSQSCKV